MDHNENMLLFAEDAVDAARIGAIDQLHHATAIYTAEPIVDELLSRLNWPSGKNKFLDPSAGDGMVIGRALTKALNIGHIADDLLPQIIEGWEIHPHACAQARARIVAILIAYGRSRDTAAKLASKIMHNADFLTDAPTAATWHTIAGNPPYLRWLNVPELLREDYARHVPPYASSDLCHSFLDRCAKTLHEGGEIGLITSDRWLFNLNASQLRQSLGERLSIHHLERLDPSTAFYRPKQRRAGMPPRIHPVKVILGFGPGSELTKEAIYPGADTERYAGMLTLGEVAQIRIAPWLGTAGVFLLSAADAEASGIPAPFLVPAVDTDDIVESTLKKPSRFAILTRPKEEPCVAIKLHLDLNIGKMATRGQGGAYLPPETFHLFDLSKPSLLVPRIARTPKAVRVPVGVLPVNHNISIVSGDARTLDLVEAALQSDLAREWMQQHAARLENGFYSLTTTLLRRLPIEL